jgi:hypothetical protein
MAELVRYANRCSRRELTGMKRNTLDKFYTRSSIVDMCLELVASTIVINLKDVVIEPSAGNGAFSNKLKCVYKNVKAFDIAPEKVGIKQQDYLLLDTSIFVKKGIKIHVTGNPPFGRQSSLAKKFIRKSCGYCDTVSFILPKSFKKESFMKTFPLEFHLIAMIDLPPNSFEVDGISHDVPCVFQIWRKESYPRVVKIHVLPTSYIYIKKSDITPSDENMTISIRRVGVNAGKIDLSIDKSAQSHYFIKFNDNVAIGNLVAMYIATVTFDFDNTVGSKSISKSELNEKLMPLCERKQRFPTGTRNS